MKKTISFLIILTLLLSLGTVSVCAEEVEYVNWELSSDESRLIADGETEYTYVTTLIGYRLENEMFKFARSVQGKNGYYYTVTSDLGRNTVYLSNYQDDTLHVYANEKGKAALLEYLNGNAAYSRLVNYDEYRAVDGISALKDRLDALAPTDTISVRELYDVERYDLVFYDSFNLLAYSHGAIYNYKGGLYYVNYDNLTNNYFDADGNFSYKSGQVEAAHITGELLLGVMARMENEYIYQDDITYEIEGSEDYFDGGILFGDLSEKAAFALLIVLISLLGIALPALPVIISVRGLKKGDKETRVGYIIMLSASLVWLICGVATLILLSV